MTQDTNQLIEQLSQGAGPARVVSDPFALCLKWLLAALAYVALMSLFLHLRPDLSEKLMSPLFAAEVGALALLAISTSLAAALLGFPDLYQKPKLLWLPYAAGTLFVLVVALAWLGSDPLAPHPINELECLTCITLLSFLPAAALFHHLRGMAPVRRGHAGSMAMLSAFAIAALTLRLCEQTDAMNHIILWHYLPLLAFNVLGIVLGRKFLRW